MHKRRKGFSETETYPYRRIFVIAVRSSSMTSWLAERLKQLDALYDQGAKGKPASL